MPEKQIASTMNTAALVALIGAGVFYILSILSAVKRLSSKKRKTSKAGIMFLVLATLFAVSAMMLHGYLSARGPALYNYSTVFYIGFFFFSLVTGLTLLNLTLRHMVTDEVFSMRNVYSSLCAFARRRAACRLFGRDGGRRKEGRRQDASWGFAERPQLSWASLPERKV